MTSAASWNGDWKERLYGRVRAKGYESVLRFAYARPAVSVLRLADELGPDDVAAVQVEKTMLAEAARSGEMERLVRDLLARYLADALHDGWPAVLDERALSDLSGALARWIASLPAEWRERAQLAARVLLGNPPTRGWKPSGAEDEVIRALLPLGTPV